MANGKLPSPILDGATIKKPMKFAPDQPGVETLLDLLRALTGTVTGDNINMLKLTISSDDVSGSPSSLAAAFINGLMLEHNMGGPNLKGVRQSLFVKANFVAPSSPDNAFPNYTATAWQMNVKSEDGGTPTEPRGAFFAGNPVTELAAGINNIHSLIGYEIDIGIGGDENGNRTMLRSALPLLSFGTARGYTYDSAVTIGALGSSLPFRNPFCFNSAHGSDPTGPDTVLFGAIAPHPYSALHGIDLTPWNFGGYSFRSNGYSVDNSGVVTSGNTILGSTTLSLNGPSHGIEIGAPGTINTPYQDWHSGGQPVDYDFRMVASGGGATAGGGQLQFLGSQMLTPSILPNADNTYSLGSGTKRFAQLYIAAPSVASSDIRLKHVLGNPEDVLLDAIDDCPISVYQFLASIAEKGEAGARKHVGVISQWVADRLTARGIDPAFWSFWCEDPLTEEGEEDYWIDVELTKKEPYEDYITIFEGDRALRKTVTKTRDVPVMEVKPLYDEETGERIILPGRPAGPVLDAEGKPILDKDGNPRVSPAVEPQPAFAQRRLTTKIKRTRPVTIPVLDSDGKQMTRLGIRYEPLIMLMIACLRRKDERKEVRITALETALLKAA